MANFVTKLYFSEQKMMTVSQKKKEKKGEVEVNEYYTFSIWDKTFSKII